MTIVPQIGNRLEMVAMAAESIVQTAMGITEVIGENTHVQLKAPGGGSGPLPDSVASGPWIPDAITQTTMGAKCPPIHTGEIALWD